MTSTHTEPPIFDTHVHFWDRTRDDLTWSWLDRDFRSERHLWTTEAHRPRRQLHEVERYITPDFRAETAGIGVAGLTHVHSATALDPADETAWLGELGERYGWPSAIVARADLAAPDAAELLRRHRAASPRCTGVRDMRGPAGLDPDACAAALDVVAELGLSVEIRTAPEGFDTFVELAERWPSISFVLSHASFPQERTPSTLTEWRRAAQRLAEHPNWFCKVSALCGGSDPNWTVDSIRPWALACIETFGVDRCMLGTNWPVDRLFGTYSDVVGAYREVFADLDVASRRQLFYGTAAAFHHVDTADLDLTGPPP